MNLTNSLGSCQDFPPLNTVKLNGTGSDGPTIFMSIGNLASSDEGLRNCFVLKLYLGRAEILF